MSYLIVPPPLLLTNLSRYNVQINNNFSKLQNFDYLILKFILSHHSQLFKRTYKVPCSHSDFKEINNSLKFQPAVEIWDYGKIKKN